MQQWFTDRIKEALIGRHRQIVHTKIFAVFKVYWVFWKDSPGRIFVVELKLKLRSLFHYEQIARENSDIK